MGSAGGSLVLAMVAGKAKSNRSRFVRIHEGTPRYSEDGPESLPKALGIGREKEQIETHYSVVPASGCAKR